MFILCVCMRDPWSRNHFYTRTHARDTLNISKGNEISNKQLMKNYKISSRKIKWKRMKHK